ncbi:MAG: sugar ABC transporter permease [Anaerolineales bacterium]|nr:MAG: sugar ABC transporter permease [Anaerolineales bacterium]
MSSRQSASAAKRPIPRRRSELSRRAGRTGLLFITPWLIGLVAFKLVPIFASLAISFTDFEMLSPEATRFIGLRNYLNILGDEGAGFSLFATVGFALVAVPLQMVVSLGMAVLLNSKRIVGKRLYRALIFLPSVVPGAVITFIWFGFLDPTTGWLNRLVAEPLGLPRFPAPAVGGLDMYQMMIAVWSIGPGFLIMLGALKGVPEELYEAGRVDGAGPVMRLFNITLPVISPAILFSLVVNLVAVFGGMQLLDRGTSFTGQSPFDSYIYEAMFQAGELGYAASLSWILFMLMLATTAAIFATARYWVYYAEER